MRGRVGRRNLVSSLFSAGDGTPSNVVVVQILCLKIKLSAIMSAIRIRDHASQLELTMTLELTLASVF